MTVAIAITGKGGSGKTTITKSVLTSLHNLYPEKSVLLVDNDLSCELAVSFGIEVRNTIGDIDTGKYKYKTAIPEQMPKHEFIEWAIHEILINLYDEIDLIATGYVSSRNCTCFTSNYINDALVKLIKHYDIVIFDCEYDLEYLHHLIDYPVDITLIIADPSITSVYSSAKIKESSLKHASPGQLGLILNKVKTKRIDENVSNLLKEYDLDILGTVPYDDNLENGTIYKDSDVVLESVEELLFRLNIPQ